MYAGTLFDLGPDGEVEIGNYCTLVGPIISTNGRVVIGDYSLISHRVVLADSFAAVPPEPDGRRKIAPAREQRSALLIGQNVWIGARAVLVGGIAVGEGAIVGAGAVVDFDVPPHAIVGGNPARVVGWAHPQRGPQSPPEVTSGSG